jgi:hypothetical protein
VVEIPGAKTTLKEFFSRPYVYDGLVAFFALSGGIAKVWADVHDEKYVPAVLWGIASVGVFVFSVLKFAVQYANDVPPRSPHSLESALTVLHEKVRAAGATQDVRLRTTLFRPVSESELEQVTEYIGERAGAGVRKATRRFDTRCGVIGRALKEKQPKIATRQSTDYEEYIQELIAEWNYNESDARRLTKDVYAWMAIPLQDDEGRVYVVVYCDADEQRFFHNDAIKEQARHACLGIAAFCNERYS